ncbi:MAG TPA: carbohydrate-binding protein, partial [Chitinophagaceae bacterium]|nr:carbohydrate-binding protein [Chitinophagaceae bacterium]
APTTAPIPLPALLNNGTHWRSVTTDYFSADTLALCWHFLNRKDAANYSLTARKGWVRLTPDSGRTSLLQKETDHYFTTTTRVDLDAADTSAKAGLYLTNGNQKTFVRLYTGFSNSRKEIVFSFDSAVRSIPNKFGQRVWLQLQRRQHQLSAFASADGKQWTPVGAPISAVNLDKTQPNYNSWVGTSMGLFAEGKPADFDFFICKDGAALLPAIGYSNYYGVEKFEKGPNPYVTNTTDLGGWLMISGVELSHLSKKGGKLAITAAAASSGSLQVWLDDLKNGQLIATVPIRPQGNGLQTSIYQQSLPVLNGQHDVFIKFPAGSHQQLMIEAIRFIASQ